MSTHHLDSGAFPALGTADTRGPGRKTPAPWDVPVRAQSGPMLGAPVRTARPPPGRRPGASSADLRVVEAQAEDAGPVPVVSARAWWAFEAGLLASTLAALFIL